MEKDERVEWSKEHIFEFLELFRGEPCIWDPLNADHRNKSKLADAWQRVQLRLSFNCALADLKKKRDSLMASYRMLVGKKKKFLKSGMASDELFKPNWFAFDMMNNFLAPVYQCDDTIKTETNSTWMGNEYENGEDANCEDRNPVRGSTTRSLTKKHINAVRKKEIKNNSSGDTKHTEEHVEQAFEIFKGVTAAKNKEKDECDLYGELLAKKLRRFNDDDRENIMLDIDTMLVQKRRQLSENTSSVGPPFISLCSSSLGGSFSPQSTPVDGFVECTLGDEGDVDQTRRRTDT